MVARVRIKRLGGDYFPQAGRVLRFIPSGCAVLDGVLGGGWPLGRISNVVGDASTGKTLLAIEACANFARCSPNSGKIFYRESEAAFDEDYARRLGLPAGRVDFGPNGVETQWDTIEDLFSDMDEQLARLEKSQEPGIYVVDSLDAYTSRAALKRKIGEASYATEKAKLISEQLSQLTRRIKKTNMHLMIISQTRDKINVRFGEKKTRSGGKALRFYASQELWLSHLKTYNRTVGGQKWAVAIEVLAKCKKNKIGKPLRQCRFQIMFDYGIDDLEASIGWLEEAKRLDAINLKTSELNGYWDRVDAMNTRRQQVEREKLRQAVLAVWKDVDNKLAPKVSKYG